MDNRNMSSEQAVEEPAKGGDSLSPVQNETSTFDFKGNNPFLNPLIIENLFQHLINFKRFRSHDDKQMWKTCRLVCQEWNSVALKLLKMFESNCISVQDVWEYVRNPEAEEKLDELALEDFYYNHGKLRFKHNTLTNLRTDFAETKNMPYKIFKFQRNFFQTQYDEYEGGSKKPEPIKELRSFLINYPSWISQLEFNIRQHFYPKIDCSFGIGLNLPCLRRVKFNFETFGADPWDDDTFAGRELNPDIINMISGLLRATVNLHTFEVFWKHCGERFDVLLESPMLPLYEKFLSEIPSSTKVLKLEGFTFSSLIKHLAKLQLTELYCRYFQLDPNLSDPAGGKRDTMSFFEQQKSSLEVLRLHTEYHIPIERRSLEYFGNRSYELPLPTLERLQVLQLSRVSLVKVQVEKFPVLKELDLSKWFSLKSFPDLFEFPPENSSPCLTLRTLSLPKDVNVRFIEQCGKFFPKIKKFIVHYNCKKYDMKQDNNPLIAIFKEFKGKDIQSLEIVHCSSKECDFHLDPLVAGIPHQTFFQYEDSGTEFPEDLRPLQVFPSIDYLQDLMELTIKSREFSGCYCTDIPVTKFTLKWVSLLKKLRRVKGMKLRKSFEDHPLHQLFQQ